MKVLAWKSATISYFLFIFILILHVSTVSSNVPEPQSSRDTGQDAHEQQLFLTTVKPSKKSKNVSVPVESSNSTTSELPHRLKKDGHMEHDLLTIVKHHKDAYTIWNITTKHKLLNKYNLEECSGVVKANHGLIGPLLVNITLRDSQDFVREFIMKEHYETKGSGSELRHASHVLNNIYNILEDEDAYFHAVQKILHEMGYDKDLTSVCPPHSYCGCIWTKFVEDYAHERLSLKDSTYALHEYVVYGRYIDPAFRLPIFVIGFVLNIILLIIFCREKSIRKEENIIIFTLCINNILMLIIYTPLEYMNIYYRQDHYYMRDLLIIEVLVTSVNAISVMCLNVKRYFDVSRVLKPDIHGCRMSSTARCIVYICVIWLWSSGVAAFCGFENRDHAGVQEAIMFIFLYMFILSIVVAVFSSLSARKLQRAAEQGQTSIEFQNITGSGLILALTILFYIVHTPFFIILLYDSTLTRHPEYYFMSPLQRAVYFIVYKLLILYPCMIPMILYKTCKVYRFYFRKYVCRWWYIPDDGEYITMSSLQNAENQE